MKKIHILAVDDEETIRKLITARMEREGFQITCSGGVDEAEAVLGSAGPVPVVITDLKMPGKDGFAMLQAARKRDPLTRVIMITGHGEKEAAIRAIREGASDYLEKPFDMDDLVHSVQRAAREWQLEAENKDLMGRLQARVERLEGQAEDETWYVSRSASMTKVNEWLNILRREAMRGAAEEPSVVILGESGTGKEGIARMIHAGSRRGKGPWVAINCANFNDQLLESELFGHEKGAFTGATGLKRGLFEIAKGGTLFLDEIGEMDVRLQAKLLRVLQERTFRRVGGTSDLETDVRVIAATNRDLDEKIKRDAFRLDLYHRLARVVVEIPALRERKDDILPMANIFAERAFMSRGKRFQGYSPEAEAYMQSYAWPGNVREMLNITERVALINDGGSRVGLAELEMGPKGGGRDRHVRSVQPGEGAGTVPEMTPSPGQSFTDYKRVWTLAFEKQYLAAVLRRHSGNTTHSASEAGLDRSNFLRLLRKHRLQASDFRKGTALVEGTVESPVSTPAITPSGEKKPGQEEAA